MGAKRRLPRQFWLGFVPILAVGSIFVFYSIRPKPAPDPLEVQARFKKYLEGTGSWEDITWTVSNVKNGYCEVRAVRHGYTFSAFDGGGSMDPGVSRIISVGVSVYEKPPRTGDRPCVTYLLEKGTIKKNGEPPYGDALKVEAAAIDIMRALEKALK